MVLGLSRSDNFNAIVALGFIYVVASTFPSISIVIRRLHDVGKQWTWIFIALIPIIGSFWFVNLMCQPGGRYENKLPPIV